MRNNFLSKLAAPWLAAVLALSQCGATIAAEIEIQTSHLGDVVTVRVQALLAAPMQVVWSTLTDYERLPEFVPGLKKSKIIARNGNTVVVQQSGEARFFLTSVPIEVTLESIENAPKSIEVRRVAGTVKRLDGRYETQPTDGAVLLSWTGSVEPENGLPPLIGEALMRRSIRQQFAGMVGEIERRELVRQSAAAANAAASATAAAAALPHSTNSSAASK
jgi:ribosome-associated toxin RatA of RatAB toxin-antitoxin module